MHGDLRGFYGTPVTYAVSVAVGITSTASLLFGHGRHLMLDPVAVIKRRQYWRCLSSQLPFHHGFAVSLGLYILFQFRVLERQMGSRRFGSFVAFVLLWTTVIQVVLIQRMDVTGGARWPVPGGPYTLLGALCALFYRYIPKLEPKVMSFNGLHFSDKSSTYLVVLMFLARDYRTLLPFVPGVVLGVLLSSTPLSRIRLPSFLCSFFALFHPLFDVVPPSVVALQRQQRIMEAQRRLGMRGNRNAAPGGHGFRDQLLPGGGGGGDMLPPHLAAAPPSEDAIQQLMALGFDRERSIQALQATNNNVEAAANRLLNGL